MDTLQLLLHNPLLARLYAMMPLLLLLLLPRPLVAVLLRHIAVLEALLSLATRDGAK
jgi:hypothetical protein